LSKFSVGKHVIFSGSFLSNETDCMREESLTQEGSMSEPAFAFRFSDVRESQ
jgi:hypothetical protein